MDYSKLSDFEINKRVADIVMNGAWHVKPSYPDNKTGGWIYGSSGIPTKHLPDYCNNPADAWPIIVSNLIEISPDYHFSDEKEEFLNPTGIWSARLITASGSFKRCEEENPLRAAMIAFLMMQEEKLNTHG